MPDEGLSLGTSVWTSSEAWKRFISLPLYSLVGGATDSPHFYHKIPLADCSKIGKVSVIGSEQLTKMLPTSKRPGKVHSLLLLSEVMPYKKSLPLETAVPSVQLTGGLSSSLALCLFNAGLTEVKTSVGRPSSR